MSTEYEVVREIATELTKKLIDSGQLIEAGWVGLRLVAVPQNAPQVQLDAMREAFFAGAHHLMASVMNAMEPGKEPSEEDMRRMAMIQSELDEFIRQFKLKHGMGGEQESKQ
jgi:hypothetical protein